MTEILYHTLCWTKLVTRKKCQTRLITLNILNLIIKKLRFFLLFFSYFRRGRSRVRKQRAFRAIKTGWYIIIEIQPWKSLKVALVRWYNPFWHQLKAVVQKDSFHDFFLSLFRQEEQGSVSLYDTQVDKLLKLSTLRDVFILTNQLT